MKKRIVFFEAVGGTNKGEDGHRRDTMPMVNALSTHGWTGEVIQLSDEILRNENESKKIYEFVRDNADGYVSRVNPGNIKEEKLYFEMLRKLCDDGLVGMPHPDAMIGYGAKDALTKLADTELVPDDTYAYYDIATFKSTFPKSLAKGERVLKQNRGSTGEGIWRVRLENADDYGKFDSLDLIPKSSAPKPKTITQKSENLANLWTFANNTSSAIMEYL